MIAIRIKTRYLGLLLSLGCIATIDATTEASGKPVWVNVFVHGIISIKPLTTLSNFFHFMNDDLEDSPYQLTVANIRQNPFFYQNQTIQAPGLQPIDIEHCPSGAAACIMARIFDQTGRINETEAIDTLYYTYGWQGLLSRIARLEDAHLFLVQLNQEVTRLRGLGWDPKIRLIGYSHGGTVILKLALAKNLYNIRPLFDVDEMYIMGTPIQYDSDYLINDPMFKKVYNIYSRGDRFQKMDFFSAGQFFSDRRFAPHCGFETVPSKLTQIEIRMVRNAKKSGCCAPCNDIDCCKSSFKNRRNVSPGHSELWFFGWTPMHYRRSFPLYPLPVVSMLPFIIDSLKPYETGHDPEKPFIITIDMTTHQMNIYNSTNCSQVVLPFISKCKLADLKQEALLRRPDPLRYNWGKFDEQIQKETARAYIQRKQKRCGY